MPALTPEQLHAAATARILRTLESIQEAQHQLGTACALLSSLRGGAAVWRATSTLHDKVHALWYKVEAFRGAGRYELDALTAATLQRDATEKPEGSVP